MDRFHFLGAWFGAALTCLTLSLLLLIFLTTAQTKTIATSSYGLYQALPDSPLTITEKIEFADGRAKIIEAFFKRYGSPLADYGPIFVAVADEYKLDYRLLPAISMQESLGGKRVIQDSYNPFGFGIYGDNVVKFTSWEEGIEKVGRTLRQQYLDKGLLTPQAIMTKYTPPSIALGGPWARGVETFMEELK